MSDNSGFAVSGDTLTKICSELGALVDTASDAVNALQQRGELPTLDVFATMLGDMGLLEGGGITLGSPLFPTLLPIVEGLRSVGKVAAAATDPYPPLRNEWLVALANYHQLVQQDADRLCATNDRYAATEQAVAGSFQAIVPPEDERGENGHRRPNASE